MTIQKETNNHFNQLFSLDQLHQCKYKIATFYFIYKICLIGDKIGGNL